MTTEERTWKRDDPAQPPQNERARQAVIKANQEVREEQLQRNAERIERQRPASWPMGERVHLLEWAYANGLRHWGRIARVKVHEM